MIQPMQHLWAPWRMAFIKAPRPSGCFFCEAAAADPSDDATHLVLARGQHTLVILNRYPYNNGHLLIAPQRHVGELHEMLPVEHLECIEHLATLTGVYREQLNAEGFNIGLNLGRVAGAGLPGHLHWHLVPRWAGDTNFMPVLAGTRVIPQSLDALWEMLSGGLD